MKRSESVKKQPGRPGRSIGKRPAKKRHRWRLAAIGVAAVILVTTIRLLLSSDPSLGASMTMRVLSPAVDIARGAAAFAPAADGDVIGEGDRARTDANGAGIINFFDGSSLTLDPSTEIGVVAIDERSNGVIASFTQAIGRTWSSVHKQTGTPRYEIKTPAATAVVRGTGFEIIVRADGFTTVRVSEGTVAVTAQGVTVLAAPGFETIVTPSQPPATPTASVVTALRVALRSPGPGGPFVALIDRLGRTCGIIDPAAVGVAGPTTLEVSQIPRCAATAPAGGVATAEVGSPTTGTYTVVIFGGLAPSAAFSLEVSGVLGGTLTFDNGAAGDVIANEIEATQLTLSVGPGGGPAAPGGLGQLTRMNAGPVPPGAPLSPDAFAHMTLLKAGLVEFVPATSGTPLGPRPTLVPPPGAGTSLGVILGSGALMFGALFMFKDFMKPVFVAGSIAGIVAFIVGGLSLLFFYRDFLITTFYTIGRLLR
jgi:hypothetical protein